MKESVFLDSDVILDTILARKPFHTFSDQMLALCERNAVRGFTSGLVIANCYYIIAKLKDKKTALSGIAKIRSILSVLPLADREIGESLHAGFNDFEDGVQFFIALNKNIKTFITRNTRDFKKASMTVLSPEEYLSVRKK